jgi:transposase InsO family protein
MENRIALNMKEIKRITVLEMLKGKEIVQSRAAVLMGISERQTARLIKKYLIGGEEALGHKNRGRPSKRQISQEVKNRALELIKEHYSDFGPVLACEMLQERHGIQLHKETIRRLMIAAQLWHPRKKRPKHRFWRQPREHFGTMQQLDGSEHAWLEGRAPRCWLIKFVDDATKEITHAEFATSESFKSVVKATIANFSKHGLPQSLYTDKGKVFRVNNHNDNDELLTQYEYALSLLNVELIHAHSPQAKGRIERSFQTDQDRLVKMMRLEKISSMEAANQYLLNVYIPKYNKLFAAQPSKPDSACRPATNINWLDIFCIREERVLRNDWTISYNNRILQISDMRPAITKPKDTISVCERIDGSIYLTIRSTILDFTEITTRPTKHPEPRPLNKSNTSTNNNPWRKTNSRFFSSENQTLSRSPTL